MIPELEAIHKEGSDLTIMNTFYQYPLFEDGKKICDDFLALVYKDNNTGIISIRALGHFLAQRPHAVQAFISTLATPSTM